MIKVLNDASYVKDDPVRPSLSYAFRKSVGEMFYIGEDKPDAIVCVAYTSDIPTTCLLYTSPSPRDVEESRMPSSA